MPQTAEERRVKVSLSLDPLVLEYLDAYVASHAVSSRSRVVELAIRDFRQRQIAVELVAQYAEPEPDEIQHELEDWRHSRRATADHALGRR